MTKFIEHRAARRTATKRIVVLYHAECTDGFGAAWAAYRKFGTDAEYFAVEHQYPIPAGLTGKELYTLDFTYPQDITDVLARDNVRVTSIDHHVSVAKTTAGTDGGVYDNEHSGSVLAWKYFHPEEPTPYLLRIIEDYDLHRYALEETEVLFDWIDQYDYRFDVYERLAAQLEDVEGRKRALAEGSFLLSFRKKLMERLLANTAYEVDFEGYRAGVVNTELFHSEVANSLAERFDIGIAWRVRPHGVYVSLRSEGKVNVAELATHYGGGGHRNSAGFVVRTVADLPFRRVEVENGNGTG
jgi:nanoRNase/pAp phosphatase (c-di-AMP/oligoRNAs hydrolase)